MGAGLSVAPGIRRWVRNSLERSKATEANSGLKENELEKTKRLHAVEEKKKKSSGNGSQAEKLKQQRQQSKKRVFRRESRLSQPATVKGFRKRRLTYANQSGKSESELSVNAPTNVVFKSGEIYEDINMPSSLGPQILGAYSCHGVEPSAEGINEICRKVNQDRGCVIYPFMGIQQCILCCIYDGHGRNGDKVSNYVMMEMGQKLAKHPQIHSEPAKALIETFLAVHEGLNDLNDEAAFYSGCTAVVMLIRNKKMWIANTGDSRAVLCTGQLPRGGGGRLRAVPLSEDHKPDNPKEMERIITMGGFVSAPPWPGLSARVWIDEHHTRVGLAMARSLGDQAVKPIGVIANPEVVERDIDLKKDRFVIMASDGVWEFLSSEEVVRVIEEALAAGGHEPAFAACERVVSKAAELWHQMEGTYRDDITVIILRLPCF